MAIHHANAFLLQNYFSYNYCLDICARVISNLASKQATSLFLALRKF